MAGIITHLAVADLVSDKLGEKIKNVPLFFGGNIAPDCIHSRENFVRSMKKHTHLRDNISDHDFLEPENLKIFHSRLEDFINKYCVKNDKYYDLYCGYAVHLITDELFIKTIRLGFVRDMKKLNIEQSDKEFFLRISSDLDNIDNRLSWEYPFKYNPKDTLWDEKDYEIKDFLTNQEITSSKGWITWNWFDNKKEYTNPEYISYESILEFIEYACNEIIKSLEIYNLY